MFVAEKEISMFGFLNIAVASPVCHFGNPKENSKEIIGILAKETKDCDVVVFPELCVTGYTCADLFRQKKLIDAAKDAILEIAHSTYDQIVFVGAPVEYKNALYNCAIALCNERIIGIVPKQNIPNYNEFYEGRWFRSYSNKAKNETINFCGQDVLFGQIIFKNKDVKIFAEVCEDLWMPIPPSSIACLHGANVLVNLSASNEIVAKSAYRRDLVANQSGRCVAAYAYASCGPTESTTDLVFGGHSIIAENSHVLVETKRVGGPDDYSNIAKATIDFEKLNSERMNLTSFGDASKDPCGNIEIVDFSNSFNCYKIDKPFYRYVNPAPFVPSDPKTLDERCSEIIGIQSAGLKKRIETIHSKKCYIGVSGGLDSTLALLIANDVYKQLQIPVTNITGITMPGFGTTSQTKSNALKLMKLLGVSTKTIDIRSTCLNMFKSMQHKPFGIELKEETTVEEFEKSLSDLTDDQLKKGDLTFENVQARIRTTFLMNHGFVLGTGDLSELALGWCTYNGDHMSMYNVNCSVPKSLVKFLVSYYADKKFAFYNQELCDTLKDIVGTTISPELLPHSNDKIVQSTEDSIGPYELHDFFLINFVRNGFSPEKIVFLANHAAFSEPYSDKTIRSTLALFLKRFFSQQFKRSCVPDGPKVGSVSLSPRGDWRMPSDADVSIWINESESND